MTVRSVPVIDVPISCVSWDEALSAIREWAESGQSHYVSICNSHSIISARYSPELHRAVAQSDMATADGAPVAWLMRFLGAPGQQRISGPDLMWQCCAQAADFGLPVYFLGSTDSVLMLLKKELAQAFPALKIAGSYSPPFRTLTTAEDADLIAKVDGSGAKIIWVGLGCPKQELWMAAHKGKIRGVMIGVGAAFDFHAGTLRRAPKWMQSAGLEWLHRLYGEPKRLWKRYLVTNSLFIGLALKSLFDRTLSRSARQRDHG